MNRLPNGIAVALAILELALVISHGLLSIERVHEVSFTKTIVHPCAFMKPSPVTQKTVDSPNNAPTQKVFRDITREFIFQEELKHKAAKEEELALLRPPGSIRVMRPTTNRPLLHHPKLMTHSVIGSLDHVSEHVSVNHKENCTYWILSYQQHFNPSQFDIDTIESQTISLCSLKHIMILTPDTTSIHIVRNATLDPRLIVMYTNMDDNGYTWVPISVFYDFTYNLIFHQYAPRNMNDLIKSTLIQLLNNPSSGVVVVNDIQSDVSSSSRKLSDSDDFNGLEDHRGESSPEHTDLSDISFDDDVISSESVKSESNDETSGRSDVDSNRVMFVASESMVMRRLVVLNDYFYSPSIHALTVLHCYLHLYASKVLSPFSSSSADLRPSVPPVCSYLQTFSMLDKSMCSHTYSESESATTSRMAMIITQFKREYLRYQLPSQNLNMSRIDRIVVFQTGYHIDESARIGRCQRCYHVWVLNHDFYYHFRFVFGYGLPQRIHLSVSDDIIFRNSEDINKMSQVAINQNGITGFSGRKIYRLSANSKIAYQVGVWYNYAKVDLLVGLWVYEAHAVRPMYSHRTLVLKNGEDIQFSFANVMECQRNSYTVNCTRWVQDAGTDGMQSCKKPGHHETRTSIFREYVKNGYLPVIGKVSLNGQEIRTEMFNKTRSISYFS